MIHEINSKQLVRKQRKYFFITISPPTTRSGSAGTLHSFQCQRTMGPRQINLLNNASSLLHSSLTPFITQNDVCLNAEVTNRKPLFTKESTGFVGCLSGTAAALLLPSAMFFHSVQLPNAKERTNTLYELPAISVWRRTLFVSTSTTSLYVPPVGQFCTILYPTNTHHNCLLNVGELLYVSFLDSAIIACQQLTNLA